jgi:hypothetical protein
MPSDACFSVFLQRAAQKRSFGGISQGKWIAECEKERYNDIKEKGGRA